MPLKGYWRTVPSSFPRPKSKLPSALRALQMMPLVRAKMKLRQAQVQRQFQRQMKEQAQQELELATSRQRLEQESLAGLKESLGLAAADLASLLVARAHVPSKLIQVAGSATPVVHVDQ